MDQNPEAATGRLGRFVARLRAAPAREQNLYAAGFAAGATVLFVAAVLLWGAVREPRGDEGAIRAGARQLVSTMSALLWPRLEPSANADSTL